jgi:hypothetical protein
MASDLSRDDRLAFVSCRIAGFSRNLSTASRMKAFWRSWSPTFLATLMSPGAGIPPSMSDVRGTYHGSPVPVSIS